MAARDADLATDHAERSLYISEVDNGADFEVERTANVDIAELPVLYVFDPLGGSAFEITGVAGDSALTSIEMIPAASTQQIFAVSEQFRAFGNYTDGVVREVTNAAVWASSTPATATVDSTGLATLLAPGTTNITATVGALVGLATLAVVTSLGDGVPPIVTNLLPAAGTGIERTQILTFDVTDETALAHVTIFASFTDGIVEVVHDGDGFRGNYVGGINTRGAIAGGFSYAILRLGGWPSTPTIELVPIDAGGNLGVVQ